MSFATVNQRIVHPDALTLRTRRRASQRHLFMRDAEALYIPQLTRGGRWIHDLSGNRRDLLVPWRQSNVSWEADGSLTYDYDAGVATNHTPAVGSEIYTNWRGFTIFIYCALNAQQQDRYVVSFGNLTFRGSTASNYRWGYYDGVWRGPTADMTSYIGEKHLHALTVTPAASSADDWRYDWYFDGQYIAGSTKFWGAPNISIGDAKSLEVAGPSWTNDRDGDFTLYALGVLPYTLSDNMHGLFYDQFSETWSDLTEAVHWDGHLIAPLSSPIIVG